MQRSRVSLIILLVIVVVSAVATMATTNVFANTCSSSGPKKMCAITNFTSFGWGLSSMARLGDGDRVVAGVSSIGPTTSILMVKISKDRKSITNASTLALNTNSTPNCEQGVSAVSVADTDSKHAYFTTSPSLVASVTSAGRPSVYKIQIGDDHSNPDKLSKVGNFDLPDRGASLTSFVDKSGKYGYFPCTSGSFTDSAIFKVDLSTMKKADGGSKLVMTGSGQPVVASARTSYTDSGSSSVREVGMWLPACFTSGCNLWVLPLSGKFEVSQIHKVAIPAPNFGSAAIATSENNEAGGDSEFIFVVAGGMLMKLSAPTAQDMTPSLLLTSGTLMTSISAPMVFKENFLYLSRFSTELSPTIVRVSATNLSFDSALDIMPQSAVFAGAAVTLSDDDAVLFANGGSLARGAAGLGELFVINAPKNPAPAPTNSPSSTTAAYTTVAPGTTQLTTVSPSSWTTTYAPFTTAAPPASKDRTFEATFSKAQVDAGYSNEETLQNNLRIALLQALSVQQVGLIKITVTSSTKIADGGATVIFSIESVDSSVEAKSALSTAAEYLRDAAHDQSVASIIRATSFSTASSSTPSKSSGNSHTGAIIGGVIGGLVVICLLVWYFKFYNKGDQTSNDSTTSLSPHDAGDGYRAVQDVDAGHAP